MPQKEILLVFSIFFYTVEAQFIIDRENRDVFRNLTSCTKSAKDFCYQLNADTSPFDNCICRCKQGYPLFRNPDVLPAPGGKFKSRGIPGCVWHANHRDECFHIKNVESGPLKFDLSKPGEIAANTDYEIERCSKLRTLIKFPNDNDFKTIVDLKLSHSFRRGVLHIKWKSSTTKNNGALIRGILENCEGNNIKESDRCFVGKISGIYNDKLCSVKTINGECCIFPFTYKSKTYTSCTTVDNAKPWCAVRLRFDNGTKWWETCPDPPVTSTISPSSLLSVSQTPSLTTTFSSSITPHLPAPLAGLDHFVFRFLPSKAESFNITSKLEKKITVEKTSLIKNLPYSTSLTRQSQTPSPILAFKSKPSIQPTRSLSITFSEATQPSGATQPSVGQSYIITTSLVKIVRKFPVVSEQKSSIQTTNLPTESRQPGKSFHVTKMSFNSRQIEKFSSVSKSEHSVDKSSHILLSKLDQSILKSSKPFSTISQKTFSIQPTESFSVPSSQALQYVVKVIELLPFSSEQKSLLQPTEFSSFVSKSQKHISATTSLNVMSRFVIRKNISEKKSKTLLSESSKTLQKPATSSLIPSVKSSEYISKLFRLMETKTSLRSRSIDSSSTKSYTVEETPQFHHTSVLDTDTTPIPTSSSQLAQSSLKNTVEETPQFHHTSVLDTATSPIPTSSSQLAQSSLKNTVEEPAQFHHTSVLDTATSPIPTSSSQLAQSSLSDTVFSSVVDESVDTSDVTPSTSLSNLSKTRNTTQQSKSTNSLQTSRGINIVAPPPTKRNRNKQILITKLILIAAITGGVCLILILFSCVCFCIKKRRRTAKIKQTMGTDGQYRSPPLDHSTPKNTVNMANGNKGFEEEETAETTFTEPDKSPDLKPSYLTFKL